MTVAGNVGIMPQLQGWDPERIRIRVRELLEMVGLPPDTYAARRPHQLSGGQRQRVGLARALAVAPPILLMDEPFGALDPVTRAEVRQLFADIQARLRTTVVLVTHDMAEALVLGTYVVVMESGRVIVRDTPRAVADSDDARVRPLLDAIIVPPGRTS
jgi:osmoprotectant transport system ATP-binding protein